MKLVNGDYVPDMLGGFVTCSGAEERMERVLFKLNCRRGGFAPMPKLGSRLYKLSSEKREYRNTAARKYILEALEEEKGLVLSEVTVNELEDGLTVMAELKYNGENSILSINLG